MTENISWQIYIYALLYIFRLLTIHIPSVIKSCEILDHLSSACFSQLAVAFVADIDVIAGLIVQFVCRS